MSLSVVPRGDVCHMRLRGQVIAAAGLDRLLLDAIQRYSLFEVDLSGVELIDERGIRMLLLLKRLGGRTVSVGTPSPALLANLNPEQLAALGATPGGESSSPTRPATRAP